MRKKQKNFYDSYDALFSKPALFTKQEKTYEKNMPKLKLKSIVMIMKDSAKTPSKSKKKEKKPAKKKLSMILAIVFLVIIFFVIKTANNSSGSFSSYSDEYIDVYPLKEGTVNKTSDKNFSTPLALSINDHSIVTNNGYVLEVLNDADIEIQKEELSVLPTNDKYANYFYIAYIPFYSNRRYERSASMFISGNITNSLNESFIKDKNSFSKAYFEKDIGEVKNGYVVTYKEGEYSKVSISRFFIFPDETGLWLKADSNEENTEKLTVENTLEEVKEVLGNDFTFLDENFTFKKSE
ncbi:hypothetical protein ABID30_001876 [Enterococcus rotai]|uniref:Uncharacterized protein n=1 Tax=Enterococcus rotai TaxID=118060 RepID=A0A0U2WTK5_9ENTE|nr:hypothetical protein [Enterococcus rotai]ALS36921.1 hypothetical protein ATZ35_07040 [Enterococcus rotai]